MILFVLFLIFLFILCSIKLHISKINVYYVMFLFIVIFFKISRRPIKTILQKNSPSFNWMNSILLSALGTRHSVSSTWCFLYSSRHAEISSQSRVSRESRNLVAINSSCSTIEHEYIEVLKKWIHH